MPPAARHPYFGLSNDPLIRSVQLKFDSITNTLCSLIKDIQVPLPRLHKPNRRRRRARNNPELKLFKKVVRTANSMKARLGKELDRMRSKVKDDQQGRVGGFIVRSVYPAFKKELEKVEAAVRVPRQLMMKNGDLRPTHSLYGVVRETLKGRMDFARFDGGERVVDLGDVGQLEKLEEAVEKKIEEGKKSEENGAIEISEQVEEVNAAEKEDVEMMEVRGCAEEIMNQDVAGVDETMTEEVPTFWSSVRSFLPF